MAGFEIAQLNVGRAVGAMDGAEMADFVARLDEINALAEASPGFVWRLQGDNGNATALHYTDDPRFIVNLSVWRSVDELWAFAYASTHKELFAAGSTGSSAARRRPWPCGGSPRARSRTSTTPSPGCGR